MRVILFLLCALSFLAGGLILGAAQSAIHEIEAFMLFLIAAVLLAGSSVVEAINVARKSIEAQLLELRPKPLPPQYQPMPQSVPPAPTPPVPDPENEAEAIWAEARRLAESGARDDAVEVLKSLVRRYPSTSIADKARRSLERNGIQ